MKPLQLHFTTCPNDTFMFFALVHGLAGKGDLKFEAHLADIEQLNQMAEEGIPDICKLSIAAFPGVSHTYELLTSGAAIGYKNGPLVVSRKKIYPDELHDALIAIPGEKTTANLLLSILFPGARRKKVYVFSSIEEVVLDGETDAGLLIHETRFTYKDKGLQLVCDLGGVWEKQTTLPVPLGGIVVRRSLDVRIKSELEELLRESIRMAFNNRRMPLDYMKKHAKTLSEDVMYQHVELYVNAFSLDAGELGKKAVETLLQKGREAGILTEPEKPIFLTR